MSYKANLLGSVLFTLMMVAAARADETAELSMDKPFSLVGEPVSFTIRNIEGATINSGMTATLYRGRSTFGTPVQFFTLEIGEGEASRTSMSGPQVPRRASTYRLVIEGTRSTGAKVTLSQEFEIVSEHGTGLIVRTTRRQYHPYEPVKILALNRSRANYSVAEPAGYSIIRRNAAVFESVILDIVPRLRQIPAGDGRYLWAPWDQRNNGGRLAPAGAGYRATVPLIIGGTGRDFRTNTFTLIR